MNELDIYDLVKTKEGLIGVIVYISKRYIIIRSFENDYKIHLKDIVYVKYVTPKCLRHKRRFCGICGQIVLYEPINISKEKLKNY